MFSLRRRPRFSGLSLPCSIVVVINRMRSNHHSLAESLHRKKIINSASYTCGYYKQDLNHVVWQCDLHSQERIGIVRKRQNFGLHQPLNVGSIIATLNFET